MKYTLSIRDENVLWICRFPRLTFSSLVDVCVKLPVEYNKRSCDWLKTQVLHVSKLSK